MIRRKQIALANTGIDIEAIVALQAEGMKARAWGMSENNNPMLLEAQEREKTLERSLDWWERYNAWCFGWNVEDAWLRKG
jgi:hypothetical protein